MGNPAKAIVVGAGIAGLTTAIALRSLGYRAELYERAGELTAAGSGLSLMSNALAALDQLDVPLDLESHGQRIETFRIMDWRGRFIRHQPLKEVAERVGKPSLCLGRAALQRALLDAAGDTPLHLGARATGFTEDEAGVTVRFADGSEARGDLVVGADGFHSAIRRQLVGPEEARDSGYLCWLALVRFSHPSLCRGYVGHYWGAGQRFGLIDIGHGRYYWWGTKNMPRSRSHAWDGSREDVLRAFDGWAEEVLQAIRATPATDIIALPSLDRPALGRWGSGRVTLIGDAAHPMLTSLGQGACMGIEDAVVLAHCLAAGRGHISTALRSYESRRQRRTHRIAALSRTVSTMEQLENPVGRFLRDGYFRLAPKSVLARGLATAMVFPGVDA